MHINLLHPSSNLSLRSQKTRHWQRSQLAARVHFNKRISPHPRADHPSPLCFRALSPPRIKASSVHSPRAFSITYHREAAAAHNASRVNIETRPRVRLSLFIFAACRRRSDYPFHFLARHFASLRSLLCVRLCVCVGIRIYAHPLSQFCCILRVRSLTFVVRCLMSPGASLWEPACK